MEIVVIIAPTRVKIINLNIDGDRVNFNKKVIEKQRNATVASLKNTMQACLILNFINGFDNNNRQIKIAICITIIHTNALLGFCVNFITKKVTGRTKSKMVPVI